MAFKKGQSRPIGAGRKKGQVDLVTLPAREAFAKIMEGEIIYVQASLAQLRAENAFLYISCLAKLMPYFLPKQIDISSGGESLQAPVINILQLNGHQPIELNGNGHHLNGNGQSKH